MINYTEKGQIIFQNLTKYINSNVDFDVAISQNLIENQYPEYEVITTDTNVFLVKGDKILKFK